jgi:hypothetical protein
MGSSQQQRDLLAHIEEVHGWSLPYIYMRATRLQHEATHRWGVPEPESTGPWSIYLGPTGPRPPTVCD